MSRLGHAEFFQALCPGVERFEAVGVELEGPRAVLERRSVLALSEAGAPVVELDAGRTRSEAQGLVEVGDSVIPAAAALQRGAQAGMGGGGARVVREDAFEKAGGAGVV